MIIHNKPTYKCEYCRKLYQIKNACIKHETKCPKNPINFRPCFNCEYLETQKESLYEDNYFGESERKVKVYHCRKKNIHLIPPKAENKGNAYFFEDITNIPMPKSCEDQSVWFSDDLNLPFT